MDALPEPLTPADCDLRGYEFMPLDVVRLIDSDLFALSSGDEFKAAVALWCKSWSQIPAASLPDDDRILAHLSGAGARWKRLKAGALRGFIKCSDGRLYHPVVAEKALEALPARQEYREKKSGESERKQREREARRLMFDQLRAVGVTPEWNIKTSDLRDLVTKHVTADDVTPVTPVTEPVTAKTGTERGEGQGQLYSVAKATGGEAPPPDPDKLFWDNAKAYLRPHVKGDPGALIGRWSRDYGKTETGQAITAAQVERPVEPVPFITATLKRRQGQGGGHDPEMPLYA